MLDFSARTNAWRGALASLDDGAHGGMPFLLAWLQKESDGNPCSFTKYREAGIWQLMPGSLTSDAGGDLSIAGTSVSAQHPVPPCATGTQTNASIDDLTPDQIAAQVQAGTNYINYAIDAVTTALQNAGSPIDQTSPDFWRFVKLIHGAPAWVKSGIGLTSQALGHPVSSWDEFEQYASSVGCWGSSHCSGTLANARSVGAYGGADPQPSFEDQFEVLSGPDQPLTLLEAGLIAGAAVAGLFGAIFLSRRFLPANGL